MNDQDMINRFEELEAGRILGDLDLDEIKEWKKLSEDPRCGIDLSLELTAALLETEFLPHEETTLPGKLRDNLKKTQADFIKPAAREESVVRPALWRRLLADTETAWAIAALFITLFVAQIFFDKSPASPAIPVAMGKNSPEVARDSLASEAGDLVKVNFGGIKDYGQMSGDVVWSDELQEGYLTLSNLPANNPKAQQYQLWIVDPDRDEKPVDGGVFNIPADEGTVVIPIRNPLAISKPKAFVITLEQPGGVVVSKQEVVVAVAETI